MTVTTNFETSYYNMPKINVLTPNTFLIVKVGAQTGHKVTLVDVSQDVLDKVRPSTSIAVE